MYPYTKLRKNINLKIVNQKTKISHNLYNLQKKFNQF